MPADGGEAATIAGSGEVSTGAANHRAGVHEIGEAHLRSAVPGADGHQLAVQPQASKGTAAGSRGATNVPESTQLGRWSVPLTNPLPVRQPLLEPPVREPLGTAETDQLRVDGQPALRVAGDAGGVVLTGK